MLINLQAAWLAFFLGAAGGITAGLFFHRPDWLGGYDSWPRRMLRLGHISFFGLGLLNLAFALTARTLTRDTGLEAASVLLLVGLATMPTVCYLSAWKIQCRHLFFIPALTTTVGLGLVTWRMLVL
ncbi:MAG: hypothetical protein IPM18_01265 [Phycisphaerales bacterium]|nr:hypothetical protein [Phycisphaerales bacterium]